MQRITRISSLVAILVALSCMDCRLQTSSSPLKISKIEIPSVAVRVLALRGGKDEGWKAPRKEGMDSVEEEYSDPDSMNGENLEDDVAGGLQRMSIRKGLGNFDPFQKEGGRQADNHLRRAAEKIKNITQELDERLDAEESSGGATARSLGGDLTRESMESLEEGERTAWEGREELEEIVEDEDADFSLSDAPQEDVGVHSKFGRDGVPAKGKPGRGRKESEDEDEIPDPAELEDLEEEIEERPSIHTEPVYSGPEFKRYRKQIRKVMKDFEIDENEEFKLDPDDQAAFDEIHDGWEAAVNASIFLNESLKEIESKFGGHRGSQLPCEEAAESEGPTVGGIGGFHTVSAAVNATKRGQCVRVTPGEYKVGDCLQWYGMGDWAPFEFPGVLHVPSDWDLKLRGEREAEIRGSWFLGNGSVVGIESLVLKIAEPKDGDGGDAEAAGYLDVCEGDDQMCDEMQGRAAAVYGGPEEGMPTVMETPLRIGAVRVCAFVLALSCFALAFSLTDSLHALNIFWTRIRSFDSACSPLVDFPLLLRCKWRSVLTMPHCLHSVYSKA